MPLKYTDLMKDETCNRDCLNDDMYVSECSYWTFLLYSLFLGFTGVNFYYAKYVKMFVFCFSLFCAGIFFSIFSLSVIPVFLLWLLIHAISFISVFFIYEDGYGKRFKF